MDKSLWAKLTDQGVCLTCCTRAHNFCLTGDESERTLFENDLLKCAPVPNPRADRHRVTVSREHCKDMMGGLCRGIFAFAKRAMHAIRQVYHAESVYLCTRYAGPMNHFHIRLIPPVTF